MKENKAGDIVVEMRMDHTRISRMLKNLLTALEASDKDLDVIHDFAGSKPPTFGVAIGGKLFDVKDVDTIKEAIKSGEITF